MSDHSIVRYLANLGVSARVLAPPVFASIAPPAPGYYLATYSNDGARVLRYYDGFAWHLAKGLEHVCGFGSWAGDTWQAAYTQWYPANQAPAHQGLYQREYPDPDCMSEPDRWNGFGWCIEGEEYPSGQPVFRWRGIEPVATGDEYVAR